MLRHLDELRLLHAIRLAVVATDRDGVITFVNEAATEAYAADTDALVGRDVSELLSSEPAAPSPFGLDVIRAGRSGGRAAARSSPRGPPPRSWTGTVGCSARSSSSRT